MVLVLVRVVEMCRLAWAVLRVLRVRVVLLAVRRANGGKVCAIGGRHVRAGVVP